MRDADDIIQLIRRAFSETPQPGPEALFNDHLTYLHWSREREEAQWAGAEPPRTQFDRGRCSATGSQAARAARRECWCERRGAPAPAAQPPSVSQTIVRSIAILERSARCGCCYR